MRKWLVILALMGILDITSFEYSYAQGQHIQIDDFSMYYEVHGSGEALLLLSGGLGSVKDLSGHIKYFSDRFRVIAPDCRGRGKSTDGDKPITYNLMDSDILQLLNQLKIEKTYVIGWSDGGIIGISMAINHPERIKKLVAISANFNPDGLVPEVIEVYKKAGPDSWPGAVESYKALSPDPDHWPILFNRVKDMWLTLPNLTTEQLKQIKTPTLIIAGDHDIIRLEHTVELFKTIKNAQLCILPGTTHRIMFEELETLNGIMIRFLIK
jgi:pimeloyl-ACP methyl ester carboxylesterase